MIKDNEHFYPQNQQEWRKWLEDNHQIKESVWVIFYKKSTQIPTITWSESVDEALCFGWIDSVKKKLDAERSIQYFSKRKAKGTWSKINKEKIKLLETAGKIVPAGYRSIELAKANGSWTVLDTVEELIVPTDLEEAFKAYSGSKEYFVNLSKSTRKSMLQWIVMAKQEETRVKRIKEIVEKASQKLKPKQF